MGRLLGLALAVTALAWGVPVRAQSSTGDKAAAEALFDEAKRLLDAEDYAQACAKLEESQGIDPGIGTMLYLGECYERLGRTASAWAIFREAASAAEAAGQGERAAAGKRRAAALEGKLTKLKLVVAPENDIEGFELVRGADAVHKALWGVPVPVDPGEHVVEAKAPGRKPWKGRVEAVGEAAVATLEVPPLQAAEGSRAGPAPAPTPGAATSERAEPPAGEAGVQSSAADVAPTGQRLWGWVLGGVGVAGLTAGAFLGLDAASTDERADGFCLDGRCERQGADLNEEARDTAVLANIAYVAGGLALGAGVFLLVTAPSEEQPRQAWRIVPSLGPKSAGASVSGAF